LAKGTDIKYHSLLEAGDDLVSTSEGLRRTRAVGYIYGENDETTCDWVRHGKNGRLACGHVQNHESVLSYTLYN